MTKSEIITIQRQLNAAGWSVKIDGVYGPETAAAYQAWLNANTPESMPTPAPAAAKPWFLSRAVIGILVSMAALAANVWGWEIDVEEATTLAVGAGGLLMALVGTLRRRAPIDGSVLAPGVRSSSAAKVSPDRRRGGSTGPFGY